VTVIRSAKGNIDGFSEGCYFSHGSLVTGFLNLLLRQKYLLFHRQKLSLRKTHDGLRRLHKLIMRRDTLAGYASPNEDLCRVIIHGQLTAQGWSLADGISVAMK
jgi:hypothetical protein